MSFADSKRGSEGVPKNTPFADYYGEFNDVITNVQTTISSAQSNVRPDPELATEQVEDAERFLEEASELANSLEMEMQSLDMKARAAVRPLVTSSRETLSRHRSAVRAVRMDINTAQEENARVRLLADGADRERIRMADATSDLETASRSIVESRRNISETEAVGASILQDLQSQRGSLMRARTNLGAVDSGIDQSSSILSSMQRRALINRIICYVVGAFIIFACVAVLFARLFRRRHKVIVNV